MGKYRKIDPRIWNDAKFMAMPDDGKLVFLFVLTHPHQTGVGAMRATVDGLASELEWTPKRFREGLREPFRNGMIRADEKAHLFALPNFLKYNPLENDNVIIGQATALDLIPECSLKDDICQWVREHWEANRKRYSKPLPEPFRNGMPKGMGNPMPNPEPEPEPEPEPNIPKRQRRRFVKPSVEEAEAYARSIDFEMDGEEFVDHYESKGWCIGKTPMKDWKAAVRTWKRRAVERREPPKPKDLDLRILPWPNDSLRSITQERLLSAGRNYPDLVLVVQTVRESLQNEKYATTREEVRRRLIEIRERCYPTSSINI